MLKSSNLQKYLRSYAEPEARLDTRQGVKYCAAIVVPACGEPRDFIALWTRTLARRAAHSDSELPLLVVLVINADEQTTSAHRSTNARLVEHVLSRPHVRLPCDAPAYLVDYQAFDLLLVNRSESPHLLPSKCGVGLARKIGGDIVSAWYARGAIECPWWMSTDADVVLPLDVVQQLCALPKTPGVACLPFTHEASGDERVNEATWAVEVELRYHALGLAYAGSKYAWPALGSCLAVHVDTYAAVRGFPKRQAGEDHYLLQKATKVGPIIFTSGEPVRIFARRSARTPFGTGRSVEELLYNDVQLTLRNPECYIWLREVITQLDTLGRDNNWQKFCAWRDEASAVIPLARVLEQIGALDAWQQTVAAALPPVVCTRRLHEWFDGLRQIQFLKGLEPVLPPLPALQALRAAPFTAALSETPAVRPASGVQESQDCAPKATWRAQAEQLRQLPLARRNQRAIPDLTSPSV